MDAHGLVGRTGKSSGWQGGYGGASRDYADPVACKAAACPCNDGRGCCGSPALAKFNSEAVCETYLEFKRNPPPVATRRCRVCGGRIKRSGVGNSLIGTEWEHDGETLSHEAVP